MGRSTFEIADAVADEIDSTTNRAIWSYRGFEIESTLLPLWELEQLGVLHISVIGTDTESVRATRSAVKDTHRILVGFQKAVSSDPKDYQAEVKELAKFLFELKDYWLTQGRRLVSIPTVYCMKAKVHVLYNPEGLESEGLYEGLLDLSFEEVASG